VKSIYLINALQVFILYVACVYLKQWVTIICIISDTTESSCFEVAWNDDVSSKWANIRVVWD